MIYFRLFLDLFRHSFSLLSALVGSIIQNFDVIICLSQADVRWSASITCVQLLSGACSGGPVPAPPFGCEKICVLIFKVKKIVLKFEQFRKCTPEMYPWAVPLFRFINTPLVAVECIGVLLLMGERKCRAHRVTLTVFFCTAAVKTLLILRSIHS